jgi:sorbitol-6-phosphate 2-dehydrogenase
MSLDLIGKVSSVNEILNCEFSKQAQNALIGGIVCSKNGKAVCGELFPEALWMDIDASFIQAVESFKQDKNANPETIFIQNKGAVFSAETEEAVVALEKKTMTLLEAFYIEKGISVDFVTGDKDDDFIYEKASELRTFLSDDDKVLTVVSLPPFKISEGTLLVEGAESRLECAEITENCKAEVISVENKAVFCAASDYPSALKLAEITKVEALTEKLTAACGGPAYLEASNTSCCCGRKGRLYGKVAVVTGGAQGFGFGIAQELAAEDAVVAIADMNIDGASKAAEKLCEQFGENRSFALEVNISSEESVAAMFRQLVLKAGGIDLLVANAGVLRAGSVKTLSKKDWDFVTDINYSGYFLCAKYAAQVMAVQNKHGKGWTDIVQVNSKSGLVGSNRNGAYAGSKFGTIGLTQSFALELVDDRIKVNSVCPGNFFDGPLWSDPERGLFVQYLNSNKVPGAKTVEDVKRFYESKIPMNRGCYPADVAKAIMYTVEQQYETGQAIPVTGGQVMLN